MLDPKTKGGEREPSEEELKKLEDFELDREDEEDDLDDEEY